MTQTRLFSLAAIVEPDQIQYFISPAARIASLDQIKVLDGAREVGVTGLKNADGQAVGVDYLKDLGVTHVHFQPLYDYATVDESSDAAQFNWGYDPKNYNAPEGSYSTDPYQVVNYMACHDNNTLWDKLLASNPGQTDEERLLMNRLGASIVMIGKGIPFFLAGEEMLRSKGGDPNSYASSDAVNNLDWASLKGGSPQLRMRDFYRGLIAMRRANPFFTRADVECEVLSGSAIAVRYFDGGRLTALAVINPDVKDMPYALPDGEWGELLNGETVHSRPEASLSGEVRIPAKGVLVVTAGR